MPDMGSGTQSEGPPCHTPDEESPTAPDEESPLTAPDKGQSPTAPEGETPRGTLEVGRGLMSAASAGAALAADSVVSAALRCGVVVGSNASLVLNFVAASAGVAQAIALLALTNCMILAGAGKIEQVALLSDLLSLCCTLTMRHDLGERGRRVVAVVCTYWFLRLLFSFSLVCVCQWALVAWAAISLAVLLLLRFAPRCAEAPPPQPPCGYIKGCRV